jgi:hypothetical protein
VQIVLSHTGTAKLEIGGNLSGSLFAALFGDINVGLLLPRSNGDLTGTISAGTALGMSGDIVIGGHATGGAILGDFHSVTVYGND